MPSERTYPGVYIEEVPSEVKTITGVSTSTALFVGRAKKGPIDEPTSCMNYSDFEMQFSPKYVGCDLARSVRLFFSNGGSMCYVVRIKRPPSLAGYKRAFSKVEEQVDIFNLLVLPRDHEGRAVPQEGLWGPASAFCHKNRAFLLMDPPSSWDGPSKAVDPDIGVKRIRMGVVRDHSAVFYPDLIVQDGTKRVRVGPSGAIAGLMARTDAGRGVWRAPAGTGADIRGIVGLERRLSEGENGTLNQRGVNVIRAFPYGIVNWGARTLDGDDDLGSDWKYIPVRRLALHIEESLYRGTQWVVFEPNDEPLWAQVRLNVGAFMNHLYRQGAFQGSKPKDAYFVKCDRETTTQDDVNRGVVNIFVGFAPLKPAEFVVIRITQMAGQIET